MELSDRVPDAKTVWLFRERLTQVGAIDVLFNQFEMILRNAGYLPMSGQILDATLVAAPRQRNTTAEKADLRAGRIPEDWQNKPSKLSHKDRQARWTLKFTKAKRQEDGSMPATDLAIPFFGYKSHIAIDRKFRLIRKSNAGKSVIHSRVEHVFADQKSQTGLFIRTVGITRATMRIGLANIVYNMRRFLFLQRINAAA
ncbi:transposase [Komagataeibacter saccharivorans NRIC 0614]|nr:transposase [Komagataeibacter saccharivorans NRIC 0614]